MKQQETAIVPVEANDEILHAMGQAANFLIPHDANRAVVWKAMVEAGAKSVGSTIGDDKILDGEPRIVINGVELTPAEAISVRVAVGWFIMDLVANKGERGFVGKTLSEGYINHLSNVGKIMIGQNDLRSPA